MALMSDPPTFPSFEQSSNYQFIDLIIFWRMREDGEVFDIESVYATKQAYRAQYVKTFPAFPICNSLCGSLRFVGFMSAGAYSWCSTSILQTVHELGTAKTRQSPTSHGAAAVGAYPSSID